MNLSEMQTALRRYGFDDEDPLTTWLNAAMREFELAYNWKFLVTAGDFPQTDGLITIPATVNKVISVQPADSTGKFSRPLRPVELHRFLDIKDGHGGSYETGAPLYYTYFVASGFPQIYIYPLGSDYDNLRVIYKQRILDMSPTQTECGLPDEYHYAVVRGAAAIALEAENEEDRAAVAAARFQAMIDKAIADENPDTMDRGTQVEDTAGYGGM